MHLFGLPGYWTRHVGMVMRVIGGDPSRSKVAASTSLMAVDRAGVGEGRTTIEAGYAGGGKDPDFWCAFEVGEVRVIGNEP